MMNPSANLDIRALGRRLCLLALTCILVSASALTDASAETYRIEEVASGLSFPVSFKQLPNGDFLVVEKFGAVHLVRDGAPLDGPIASFDVTAQNEAGLLSVELTPDFEQSGQFLVAYTPEEPLEKMYVSRLELVEDRARVLDEPLIEVPSRPQTDRHYGGNIRFGPDGYLYMGLGDLTVKERAQDSAQMPGSLLRFNADGTVPDDNPFGADNPVWATGLRNPFDFDISSDGRVFVGDNGEDINDEVNEVVAGSNYGWPLLQGFCDNRPSYEPCENADAFAAPAHEFRTIIGPTGVLYYEGDALPEVTGQLLVAGWHSGKVHRLEVAGPGELFEPLDPLYRVSGDFGITDIEQSNDGTILLLAAGRDTGKILEISVVGGDDGSDDGSDDGTDSRDSEASADEGCSSVAGSPLGAPWLLAFVFLAFQRIRRRCF